MSYSGLFAGLTTVDIQYHVDDFPGPNVKIKAESPEILVGGPATNAAVAFAALNGSARLVSAVGDNSFTELVNHDFKQTKVGHTDLAKSTRINPVLATVVTSKNDGHRNIFTHNPELLQNSTDPAELIQKFEPEIVLLDGFYPEFSIPMAKEAAFRKIPVVLDCGSWKPQYDQLFPYTETAICSADFMPPGCSESTEIIDYIQKSGVKNVAISRGGQSIIYKQKGSIRELSVQKIKAVDTLGAGDFLHGAFCFYRLQLQDFGKALLAASRVATYSCKFRGTREWLNSDFVMHI